MINVGEAMIQAIKKEVALINDMYQFEFTGNQAIWDMFTDDEIREYVLGGDELIDNKAHMEDKYFSLSELLYEVKTIQETREMEREMDDYNRGMVKAYKQELQDIADDYRINSGDIRTEDLYDTGEDEEDIDYGLQMYDMEDARIGG